MLLSFFPGMFVRMENAPTHLPTVTDLYKHIMAPEGQKAIPTQSNIVLSPITTRSLLFKKTLKHLIKYKRESEEPHFTNLRDLDY